MIASVTSQGSDRCLPPSERAFEAYRLIEIDGLSTRAAAEVVGLSQTRVIQLRDAVEEYVARQPSGPAGLTKQQRLQAAEYKASQRLDHLYRLALEAFRQSQGPEITSEDASGGQRVVKTRMSFGNIRYLQMAARIAAQQSRIPATPIATEFEDGATAQPHDDLQPDEHPKVAAEPITRSETAYPPEEDCSLVAAQPTASGEVATDDSNATETDEATSHEQASNRGNVTRDVASEFTPVQMDFGKPTAPVTTGPVLTRRERRRRARMLRRAK